MPVFNKEEKEILLATLSEVKVKYEKTAANAETLINNNRTSKTWNLVRLNKTYRDSANKKIKIISSLIERIQ